MSLVDVLLRAGAIRTVDHALAQSLRRHAPDTHALVLAGAALAAHAVGHGHAAFDPARPHVAIEGIDWPDADAWHAAWSTSRWIAHPALDDVSVATPLVVEHGLLYLRRYREYERALAQGLQRILRSASLHDIDRDAASVDTVRDALFPPDTADAHQRAAADAALRHALLLITGGPGTGKTTTIARVLALLVAQAQAPPGDTPRALRIALAAPTGRAAERMASSLRRAVESLRGDARVGDAVLDALPTQATTLHRLLGPIPDSATFRHHAGHPLGVDVVVVDEASMVDLPLIAKLVDAVPDGARLVLLGDADQLPSVEAGDVLAAMVTAGDAGTTHAPAIPHVHLQRAYRQSDTFDLAPLADALRAGDADAVLALMRNGQLRGVRFVEDGSDLLALAGRDALLDDWRALREIDDPAAALDHAQRLRVLTAVREGAQGTRGLNARIEAVLVGAQHPPYFHGRLLLVTENSPRHGLSNGDIGVCMRRETNPLGGQDVNGDIAAWFRTGDGLRAFHPATLPAHESAFAMTVHKAQGSEFDRVWLQLPARDVRVLARELLYTAATRARRELVVLGSEAVLRAALARRSDRTSGLPARLRHVLTRP